MYKHENLHAVANTSKVKYYRKIENLSNVVKTIHRHLHVNTSCNWFFVGCFQVLIYFKNIVKEKKRQYPTMDHVYISAVYLQEQLSSMV